MNCGSYTKSSTGCTKLSSSDSTFSSRLVCEKREVTSKHVEMPKERLRIVSEQLGGGYDIKGCFVLEARSILTGKLQCLVQQDLTAACSYIFE